MAKHTAKITLIAAIVAVPLATVVTLTPADAAVPGVTKVLIVMEENHSMTQMQTGMPYTFSLAQTYGYATRWAAIRHPSLPNYIALGSGQTYGITDDKPPASHVLRGKSIFGQAVAAGKTAKSYNEGMTSNCKTGNTGEYRVKHNPWAYFPDERTACLAGDVATGTLTSGGRDPDLSSARLSTARRGRMWFRRYRADQARDRAHEVALGRQTGVATRGLDSEREQGPWDASKERSRNWRRRPELPSPTLGRSIEM